MDEQVRIDVSAPGAEKVFNDLQRIGRLADDLARKFPGGRFPASGVPAGAMSPKLPTGAMPAPGSDALREAHNRAVATATRAQPPGRPTTAPSAAGAQQAMQALLQSGSAAAVPLAVWMKENSALLGLNRQRGGTFTARGAAPNVPQDVFANLLQAGGALRGGTAGRIRGIAGRVVGGTASAADLRALQVMASTQMPEMEAASASLDAQYRKVQANLKGGSYRTVAQQANANKTLQSIAAKGDELGKAMTALDSATTVAQNVLASAGRGPSAASRALAAAQSVGGAAFRVGRRVASALGPVAGIGSLGFVGASVGSYWSMAAEGGRAWTRAGMPGGYSSYFNAVKGMAGQGGYTVPATSAALSAVGLYSGNTAALASVPGVLTAARAMGVTPEQAATVLAQVASYGPVGANGQVALNSSMIAGRAAASGIDPRVYASALASLTSTAGATNANVSAGGVSALLSSANTLARTTGLSAFRGSRGASWLQSFQQSTQSGLGGSSGEYLTLAAIRSAWQKTNPGKALSDFHLFALQSEGPLGWNNAALTSAYVGSLWSRFKPMGAFGDLEMAKALGMSPAQFYSLQHSGGVNAVTQVLLKPPATASVSSRASAYMASSAGGVASAQSTISTLTAQLGQGLSPAVVKLTGDLGKLDSWLTKTLGGSNNVAAALVAAVGAGMVPSGPFGIGKLVTGAGIYGALTGGGAAPLKLTGSQQSVAQALAAQKPTLGTQLGAIWQSLTHPFSNAPAGIYERNDYGQAIGRAALSSGLPPALIAAVLRQEDPTFSATAGSRAHAYGPMQIEPYKTTGVPWSVRSDPTKNILAGSNMLSSYLRKYGNLWGALTAYNAGPAAAAATEARLQASGEAETWANAQKVLPSVIRDLAAGGAYGAHPNVAAIIKQALAYPGSVVHNVNVLDQSGTFGSAQLSVDTTITVHSTMQTTPP